MKTLSPPAKWPPAFLRARAWVAAMEGGWSNHPDDSGGATRWGVTKALAECSGFYLTDRTEELCKAIFYQEFWLPLSLSTLASRSTWLASEIFEAAVNAGPGAAARFLQVSLNLLSPRSPSPTLKVDGALGPVSLRFCLSWLAEGGKIAELALINAFNGEQYLHYKGCVERNEKNKSFIKGWCAHRLRPVYALGLEGPALPQTDKGE